jgi:multidrug resistance protein, MATE family
MVSQYDLSITHLRSLGFMKKARELFLFSLPIIIGQMGQMLFVIGDLVVVGRYSPEVVSAIGVAGGIFAPFILVALGLCFAVSPIVSRMRAQNEDHSSLLWSSYVTGLGLSIILMLVLSVVILNLSLFGLIENIEPLVERYLWIVMPSIIGIVHFQISKEYLQAYEDTYFSNGIIIVFNVLNVLVNAILVFGFLGFPELGITGAAIGSLVGRMGMALWLFLYLKKRHNYKAQFNVRQVKDLVQMGLPISASIFFEVMVISTVTVLIGRMNVTTSAAHNIVLNMASFTFMVPLGMSSAAAVKMAHAYGKRQLSELKEWATSALLISTAFMSITALLYFIIPRVLISFFTHEIELIEASVKLLFFAAIFQIPDGIQITMLGLLRGMGITKRPMIMTFIANWLVALPLGIYFAFYRDMEASGLWLGLTLGLTMMSLALGALYGHEIYRLQKLWFKADQ